MRVSVRLATIEDLDQITDIYNHYIENSSVTFDLQTFRTTDRTTWFSQFSESSHPLYVAECDGQILGYAGATRFRPKAAYNKSVEVTIYLRPNIIAQGIGTRLYTTLFSNLSKLDIHRCYAVITLPNEASIALHRKFGFNSVGTLNEVGFKFDQYWDTQWFEKAMPARVATNRDL